MRVGCFLLLLAIAGSCVKNYPEDREFLFLPGPGVVLGGFVAGLEDPGLVLQSGAHFQSLSQSGSFQFDDRFEPGEAYDVVLASVPAGYICSIRNGDGVITEDRLNVQVDCLKAAEITPADQSVIQASQPIEIRFTRSMTGCTVDGSTGLGTDSHSIAWSTTNVVDDTLTVTPTGNWNAGANRILQLLNCQDTDGFFNLSTGMRYFIASDARYVSMTGDDLTGTNDCSVSTTPCATIAHAISQATGCGGANRCAIQIANGTYNLGANALNMSPRISLMGGFSADFSSRNPWANGTVLTGSGNGCGAQQCILRFNPALDAETGLDGLQILGPGGTDSTAVYMMGGGSFHNVRLDPGSGTTSRTGLIVDTTPARTVLLEAVRIQPQDGTSQDGLGLRVDGGTVRIHASVIQGSSATQRSIAMEINGGDGEIDSSFLFARDASNISHGLAINAAGNWRIGHNYIRSQSTAATESIGLEIGANPTGPVYNNLIQAGGGTNQYCIRDLAGLPATLGIRNNNLWDCPGALLRTSVQSFLSICTGNFGTNSGCGTLYTGATSTGNISFTPSFVNGSSDFRFSVSNPCSVSEGGVDPTAISQPVLPDALSGARPGGDGFYSIGPIEAHLACTP